MPFLPCFSDRKNQHIISINAIALNDGISIWLTQLVLAFLYTMV